MSGTIVLNDTVLNEILKEIRTKLRDMHLIAKHLEFLLEFIEFPVGDEEKGELKSLEGFIADLTYDPTCTMMSYVLLAIKSMKAQVERLEKNQVYTRDLNDLREHYAKTWHMSTHPLADFDILCRLSRKDREYYFSPISWVCYVIELKANIIPSIFGVLELQNAHSFTILPVDMPYDVGLCVLGFVFLGLSVQ